MRAQPEVLPFNRPTLVGNELQYIRAALDNRQLSSGGAFGERCERWLEDYTRCRCAILTHSCTGALEIAAHLLELEPGDEVIMPSFTFVSTAAAFALRRAVPVFVDVRPDTLNLDERLVEAAVTSRTKAIVAVHYAGVPAEMDALRSIAQRHGLAIVEDAAQALMSTYRGVPAGSLGNIAALSFHETKNVISGEGGALLLRDERWIDRAQVLRDKGTNRQRFFRGEVDKYTWIDLGSSYGMSELNAAFLWAQLEWAESILTDRKDTWSRYHEAFEQLELNGVLARPVVPTHVQNNAHMYYVLLRNVDRRDHLLRELNQRGVNAVFHYVPLHSSEAGLRYGRAFGEFPVTDTTSERLLRLPLWNGMSTDEVDRVITALHDVVGATAASHRIQKG